MPVDRKPATAGKTGLLRRVAGPDGGPKPDRGTGDLRGGRKVLMAGQQPAGSPRGTRRFGASNGLIAVSPERCVSHCRNFQNMGVPVLVDSGCTGAQL